MIPTLLPVICHLQPNYLVSNQSPFPHHLVNPLPDCIRNYDHHDQTYNPDCNADYLNERDEGAGCVHWFGKG